MKAPAVNPRPDWKYGKSVVDGQTQYFSASALTSGDHSGEGCERSWYYQHILGLKKEPTEAQKRGVELHSQVERYLKGEPRNVLGPLAAAGLHMIEAPGKDLMVERDIAIPYNSPADPRERELVQQILSGDFAAREVYADYLEEKGAHALAGSIRRAGPESLHLAAAPLRVNQVPMVGFIDVVHNRGTNKGAGDVEDARDPEGTIEVVDWKTSGGAKWIKTPQEMAKTIQMTIYGKWVLTLMPDVEHVRLSHGYFLTKGPGQPRKVTLRVHRDDINRRWEHVERVAGSISLAAGASSVDDVPANTRACGAFGGCLHKPYCKAAMHNSLSFLVGTTAGEALIKNAQEATMTLFASTTTAPAGSFMDGIKTGNQAAIDAELAKLAAEEAAARAEHPLLKQVNEIESVGIGFPTLTGNAAAMVAAAKGLRLSAGAALAGTGDLASYNIGDVTLFPQVLDEVKKIAARRAAEGNPVTPPTPAPSVVPPDAPASDPGLATSGPSEDKAATKLRKEQEKAAAKEAEKAAKLAAKEAAKAAKTNAAIQTEMQQPSDAFQQLELGNFQAPTEAPPAPAPQAKPAQADHVTNAQTGAAVHVFVDCVTEGGSPRRSLWPLINKITSDMAVRFGGDDYRTCDPNGPLGFGRWKGVLASCLRDAKIPGGSYDLMNSSSELGVVAVEALRGIATATGGSVTVGVRA